MTTEIKFSDHESTFSLSFSSFYRLFSAKANFFCKFFLLLNFFLFFERKQTNFGVPREGTILFLSRRLSFVVPRENFCPKGRPFWVFLVNEKRSLSEPEKLKRAVPKDKNSPKGQQSSTWGTKTILYPPKGHQNLFVSSRWKKGKIWAAKTNLKKIGLGRKKPAKIWKRQWKSGFVVRKVYLRGRFLFHRHNFLLLSFIWF